MTGQDLIDAAKEKREKQIADAATEVLKNSLARIDCCKQKWEQAMNQHNIYLSMSVYDLANIGCDFDGRQRL